MSYTGSRSYGAGRIYSVPHYNVYSQHTGRQRQNNAYGVSSNTAPSPDGSSSAPGSRLRTPAMPDGSPYVSTPSAGSSMPRSTPGTTPATPSEAAPRGSIPGIHIPGTPPADSAAPQRSTPPASPSPDSRQTPDMMPSTGSQSPADQRSTPQASPGTMPGTNRAPMPQAPTPRTTPNSPGTIPDSGSSAMPRTTPGTSGTMPGSAGSAMPRTAPRTSGTMPGTMQGTTPNSREDRAPGSAPDSSPSESVPRDIPGFHLPGTPPADSAVPQRGTTPVTPAPGAQTPGMRPATPPANQRGTTPTVPGVMPGTPGIMPGGTPGTMPGTNQTPMPQAPMNRTTPGGMPHTMPGSMHTAPGAVPGALPNSMQGSTPGSMPGTPGSAGGSTPGVTPGAVPNGMINGMEQRGSEGFHYFISNNLPVHNPYKAPMGIPLYPLYGYDSCEELDKDAAYMKQLYPSQAKVILPYIESECDQMEYDGSVMFDEYPDRVALDRIVDRIYEKVKDLDEEEAQVEAKSIYFYPQRRYGSGLRDIITLLLLNEIFNRRRRYRSRRRWF